jgi:hypothetical protein
MFHESTLTRLRATFRNSVVWGVAWGTLGTLVTSAMRMFHNIPVGKALIDGLGMGIRIGIMGAIAGAAFVAFIGLAYRGKRLSEISCLRFGIGGAIVAGVFVPSFVQAMNLLSGSGLVPWHLLTDDIVLSAVFGGITAAGTMLLAQRGEVAEARMQDPPDHTERESLGAGAAAGFRKAERARSAERP